MRPFKKWIYALPWMIASQSGLMAQTLDDRREDLDDIIDIAFLVHVAEAQTEGTVGDLMLQADGEENMARIQGAAGARAARGGGDAVKIEHQQKRFALHALKAEADVSRKALLAVSVQTAAVNLQDRVNEFRLHPAELRVFLVHRAHSLFQRDGKTHNPRDIFRAGAAVPLLRAAVDQVRQGDPFADIERADALRGVKLVAGKREHVDVFVLDVDRDVADRLHRVGVEQDAVLFADRTDLGDGLDRTDLIVRVHDGHERRLVRDRSFQLFRDDDPVFMHVQISDREALFFQSRAGVEHGVVFKF